MQNVVIARIQHYAMSLVSSYMDEFDSMNPSDARLTGFKLFLTRSIYMSCSADVIYAEGECTVRISNMNRVSSQYVDDILSKVFDHLRTSKGKLRLFLIDETPGQGLCPQWSVLIHVATRLREQAPLLNKKLSGTALITELDDNAILFYNLFKGIYKPKRPFEIHSTKVQAQEQMFQMFQKLQQP